MKKEMIITLLHIIYCLPLSNLFLFVVLVTFGYFIFYFQFHPSKYFLWFCSISYIFIILSITLATREPASTQSFCFIPFASVYEYFHGQVEKLRESVMNLVLFYPLGLLLGSVSKKKGIICVGLFLSLCIEVSQFIWKLGYAETDDVIHNTLGVAIGVLFMMGVRKKLSKGQKKNGKADK